MTGAAIELDRRAGRALVGFGVIGLASAIALGIAMALVLGPVAIGIASFETQRASAMTTLDSAAVTLDTLSGAARDAGTSLVESDAAVRDAASVTSQLADAMAGLGFLSSGFADAAGRSRTLSADLARAADSLQRNEADSQAVSDQLAVLARQVRDLRTSLGSTSPGGDTTAAIGIVILLALVFLLLGWLATAATACVWLGRRALRSGAPLEVNGAAGLDSRPPINRY